MTDIEERPSQTAGDLAHIGGLIDINKYQRAQQLAAARAAAGEGVPSGKPRPNCPLCYGAGFTKTYLPGGYGWEHTLEPCACRRAVFAQKRQARLDRWSTLEDEWKGATLDRCRPLKGQEHALPRVTAYAKAPAGFFVLMGEFGTGKSHLAAAIAWEAYHAGVGVLWIKAGELVLHLRDTYRRDSPTTTSEQLQAIMDAPLLCLDELGAETDARDVQDHINTLIDYRYRRTLPTVIATNKTLDELGGRVASRVAESGTLVYVGGGDKRLRIDDPVSGRSKYHYYNDRPVLCSVCHGRPHLSGCTAGGGA